MLRRARLEGWARRRGGSSGATRASNSRHSRGERWRRRRQENHRGGSFTETGGPAASGQADGGKSSSSATDSSKRRLERGSPASGTHINGRTRVSRRCQHHGSDARCCTGGGFSRRCRMAALLGPPVAPTALCRPPARSLSLSSPRHCVPVMQQCSARLQPRRSPDRRIESLLARQGISAREILRALLEGELAQCSAPCASNSRICKSVAETVVPRADQDPHPLATTPPAPRELRAARAPGTLGAFGNPSTKRLPIDDRAFVLFAHDSPPANPAHRSRPRGACVEIRDGCTMLSYHRSPLPRASELRVSWPAACRRWS